MSINQENFNIRLQKLICCIGALGSDISKAIAIGNCYKDKLAKLKILIGYLEALECYTIGEETLATATFTFLGDPGSGSGSIELFANNIPISGIFNVISGTILDNNTALATQINSYQSIYTASIVDEQIVITGPCYATDLTIEVNDRTGWSYDFTTFINGLCIDNCLTEKQVLEMFERISKYCQICFPSEEYNFIN